MISTPSTTHSPFILIKKILIDRFVIPADKIQPESDLQATLALDSMDALDLLFAVNEVFSIRVPEKSLADIHTINDLINTIKRYK